MIMKKLSKEEMKKIIGGRLKDDPGTGGECTAVLTCSDGTTHHCFSHGATSNPQGGDSCQAVQGVVIDCYDDRVPGNWVGCNCTQGCIN